MIFLGIFTYGLIAVLNSEFIKQLFDVQNLDLSNINIENITNYLKLLNGDTGI